MTRTFLLILSHYSSCKLKDNCLFFKCITSESNLVLIDHPFVFYELIKLKLIDPYLPIKKFFPSKV